MSEASIQTTPTVFPPKDEAENVTSSTCQNQSVTVGDACNVSGNPKVAGTKQVSTQGKYVFKVHLYYLKECRQNLHPA